MAESRCIICGEKKDGLEVNNDHIISAIRWFKTNVTKNEKNYKLVVGKECFLKYKKARDSYLRKEIAYTLLGIFFAVLLIIVSTNKLATVFYGAFIVLLMYLLAQLSYMPGVKMPAAAASAGRKR